MTIIDDRMEGEWLRPVPNNLPEPPKKIPWWRKVIKVVVAIIRNTDKK